MLKKQLALTLLLIGIATGLQGCVVAALGLGAAGAAGTVAYVRGDLETVEIQSLDTVYRAAERAVDELELYEIEKSKDAMSATIVARDAEDKKIEIKLKATPRDNTELSIRVGTFGDETKSRIIYDRIKEHL